MSDDEGRHILLAMSYDSVGGWTYRDFMADNDAAQREEVGKRAAAALAEGATDAEVLAILSEHTDSAVKDEPNELRHWLLKNHPDLAAGFPRADYPDQFHPEERAKQVAAILAALVERLNPANAARPHKSELDVTSPKLLEADWAAVAMAKLFLKENRPASMSALHKLLKAEGFPNSRQSVYELPGVLAAAEAAGIYHPNPKRTTPTVKGSKGKDGSIEAYRLDDEGAA